VHGKDLDFVLIFNAINTENNTGSDSDFVEIELGLYYYKNIELGLLYGAKERINKIKKLNLNN
jgi:hypothetical protein